MDRFKLKLLFYVFLDYPQCVNAMDQNKRTPLHYAAALRDGFCSTFLIVQCQ